MKKYMVQDVISGYFIKTVDDGHILAPKPQDYKSFCHLAFFLDYEYAEDIIKKVKKKYPNTCFTIIEVFV